MLAVERTLAAHIVSEQHARTNAKRRQPGTRNRSGSLSDRRLTKSPEAVPPNEEVEVTAMRIGIVNDLGLARFAMQRVLVSSPHHEVAWMANDGVEAIVRAREDRPDLILMDLFMPRIDGVEATRQIMSESPCAILLVTSTVSGHLDKVYEAMGHGALDAIDTPTLAPGVSSAAPSSC